MSNKNSGDYIAPTDPIPATGSYWTYRAFQYLNSGTCFIARIFYENGKCFGRAASPEAMLSTSFVKMKETTVRIQAALDAPWLTEDHPYAPVLEPR